MSRDLKNNKKSATTFTYLLEYQIEYQKGTRYVCTHPPPHTHHDLNKGLNCMWKLMYEKNILMNAGEKDYLWIIKKVMSLESYF